MWLPPELPGPAACALPLDSVAHRAVMLSPATAAQQHQRESLAGLVERVTFHNPENGFCVLRVKVRGQRDLVTVVGHAAMISPGEFV